MTLESTSAIAGTSGGKASSSSWTIDTTANPVGSTSPCDGSFARTLAATPDPASAQAVGTSAQESAAASTLAVWLEDEQRLQLAIDRALDGSASSPEDLIRLQVLVAGASLRVETATRVVDRCVQSIKQLTQQQI